MLNSKSFLCVDFGAGSLKIAEFEKSEDGALRLKQFGIRPLGLEGAQETARERTLLKALQELMAQRGFSSKQANVCAPGFHVFSKFVKLPPVDSSKVGQIIEYEARQNVPFPLEEVVWDYQILGTSAAGEMEVLLVAIKADIVESLFRVAEASHLRLQVVDASPAALTNCFRYNYGDFEGCTMLLDIGAKTSNVLFFDKGGKVYSRGINIGANSITQDFMAEAKIRFAEAEEFKIKEGFVSLGGAYEEPENPRQAQVSKVARQVMTRLHIQVNQTIQFYRGQQGGAAPQRLLLAGGASVMPYAAQFFAEKLNVPVEYFNPFRAVELQATVDREELAKVAHSFGEVVGIGLRSLAQCPVELNLIPKSLLKRQQFSQKKPYFVFTAISLILVVFAYGWFFQKTASIRASAVVRLKDKSAPLETKKASLDKELGTIKALKKDIDNLGGVLEERLFWAEFLSVIRTVMIETELQTRQKLGVETGLWFESFKPELPGEQPAYDSGSEEARPRSMYMDPVMMRRYGLFMPGGAGAAGGGDSASAAGGGDSGAAPAADGGTAKKSATSTNELSQINVTCRGINNTRFKPSANNELAFDFQTQLQNNPLLKPFLDTAGTNATRLSRELDVVSETDPTFSFGVTLKLKRPIKLL